MDRDEIALCAARQRLAPYMDRVTLVHANFQDLDRILQDLGIPAVDGILLDLGVSSPQLDDGQRGFSYMEDAPLDMRMDRSAGLTAFEVVNTWPREELRRILYAYGEERYAPQIAAAIDRPPRRCPQSPRPWSWWTSSARQCLPRLCGRNSTRPSVAFRPFALQSMMN